MKRLVLGFLTCLSFTLNAQPYAAQRDAEVPVPSKQGPLNDELAWLGSLPSRLTRNDLRQRYFAAVELARNDMRQDGDLKQFVCKRPAEVGPVPQMEAVEAWLDAWPDAKHSDALVGGLYRAAAAGNWLARAQLYTVLKEDGDASLEGQYRWVQLVEWLQQRKLGQLYAMMGYEVESSGYWSDRPGQQLSPFDVAAALHHSYPAQNKVGSALADSSDPALAAIGKKLLACASGSLPSYARIFSGETERRHKAREQARTEAAMTPLMRAVQRGNGGMVDQELTRAGTDPNARNLNGESALTFALQLDPLQPAIIKALIKHGAKVREHGPIGAYPFNHVGLLNLAVKAADLEVVQILVKAGAEAFEIDDTYSQIAATPFGEVIDAYQTKSGRAMFDWLLATAKLAPRSALATEFADYAAAGQADAFQRLLAYGAQPSIIGLKAILDNLGSDRAGTEARLSDLLRRYPALTEALRSDAGYELLSDVVSHCNFEPAMYLIESGVPLASKSRVMPGALISAAQHCSLQEPARALARFSWLKLLGRRSYDFNAEAASHCPAWMTDIRDTCQLPDDDAQINEFLSLGADPFRVYQGQPGSAVMFALANCRPKALELFLAKAHGRDDRAVQRALREVRAAAGDARVCHDARQTLAKGLRSRSLATR